jgi:hypothetical protein
MAASLLGGNSVGLCKQPSVRASTEQVEGAALVEPAYSSETWKRKLDPNWRA